VPAAAVIREGNTAYVYVGEGNGRFLRRNVTLGGSAGDSVEIASGLKVGDTIVSSGTLLLRGASGS